MTNKIQRGARGARTKQKKVMVATKGPYGSHINAKSAKYNNKDYVE